MTMDEKQFLQRLADLPATPTASDYREIGRALLPYIQAQVPPMGEGCTSARLRFLTTIARHDLSLARLMEGHLDATQILREAGRPADPGCLYGVWASGGPADTLQVSPGASGGETVELAGQKPFCSGADIVDRALIHVSSIEQLLEVPMRGTGPGARPGFDSGLWQAPAFEETHTWTVLFDRMPVPSDAAVGPRKWYFERPGFCLGAMAPAACWAGGALALVDAVRSRPLRDGHARAHLGAMLTQAVSMRALLDWGAEQIDIDPTDASGDMFSSALLVRHHVERGCTEILDRFGRTLGPRPYAFDTENARRIAELNLYIRQCHAERDLEELGEYASTHPDFPGFLAPRSGPAAR